LCQGCDPFWERSSAKMKGKETGGITQAVSDKETQMGGRAEEGLMTIYEMNGNTCCNCGKHEP